MKQSCFIFFLLFLLIPMHSALSQNGSDFKDRHNKKCFDSQARVLVPCPKSGKPLMIEKEKTISKDEALSFLKQLEPYTRLDDAGNPLPASADEWAMVQDNETGLTWEIKSQDKTSIRFYANKFSWENLQKAFIKPLNEEKFGGFSDWRLPTPGELSTIMIDRVRVPRIDTDFFPYAQPNDYWTGLFRTDTPDYACNVDFYIGTIHYSPKSRKNYVRAVRGGQ